MSGFYGGFLAAFLDGFLRDLLDDLLGRFSIFVGGISPFSQVMGFMKTRGRRGKGDESMAKTQNTVRVLPTGEEPLKGFEQLYAARKRNKGLRVERVSATQLSSLEIRELERLRSIAIANVQRALNRNERPIDFSFEREMNIWPEGKSPTDKLTFRAFDEGFLRGYALVVRGWPSGDAWTIQHLIIDPSCRLQGIGAHIVQAIEDDALSTTESTRFIDAVPVSSNNLGFWEYSGYASIGDQVKIAISDYEFSFQRYRKAIR